MKRYIYRIEVMLLLLVLFFSKLSINAYASNREYETETIYDYGIWNNLNLTYSDKIANFDSPIVSFAVSESGEVAVALNNCKIILYKNDKPIGTIKFTSAGSYYVFWHDSNLCIYFSRGDLIIEVTKTGKLVRTSEITDNFVASTVAEELSSTNNLRVQNYNYIATKRIGFFNMFLPWHQYTLLEKVDIDTGDKICLYDCGSNIGGLIGVEVFFDILFLGGLLVVSIAVIVTLVKVSRKDLSSQFKRD